MTTTRPYAIATVPGDGIGPETVAAARRVLDVVSETEEFTLTWQEHPRSVTVVAQNAAVSVGGNDPNAELKRRLDAYAAAAATPLPGSTGGGGTVIVGEVVPSKE